MSKALAVGYNDSKSIFGGATMDDHALDWSAHDNCTHIPNAETIAAMEETEEIIRQIKAGTRKPMTLEEFFAEKRRWLEEDDEDEAV